MRQALAGGDDAQAGRGEVQQFVQQGAGATIAQLMQVIEKQGETAVEGFQLLEDARPERAFVGRHEGPLGQRHIQRVAQVQ
ncbi:hypothetical protein D3C76_749700 [compost metagenome]